MDWFRLYVQDYLSPERTRIALAATGAHLRLSCACARCENGGRIVGGAGYGDRDLLVLAGITVAELEPVIKAGLARRDGDDLVVLGYDAAGEQRLQKAREDGSKGGKLAHSRDPSRVTSSDPSTQREEERREEEDLCEPGGSRPHASPAPIRGKKGKAGLELAAAVVEHLNATASRAYTCTKPTVDLIRARAAGGATLDDFKRVIEHKTAEWRDDPKMGKFLRPATLFQTSKFPGYLDEARAATNGAADHAAGHDFLSDLAAERGEPS